MIAYILFFSALLWAAVEDLRRRIIPDAVHFIIMASGLVFIFFYNQSWSTRLIAFTVMSLLMVIAILALDFAGGDVKLMASVSFALGFFPGLLSLMVGLFLAAIFAMPRKRKKTGVPLAPFILAGCLSVLTVQNFIPINILI